MDTGGVGGGGQGEAEPFFLSVVVHMAVIKITLLYRNVIEVCKHKHFAVIC